MMATPSLERRVRSNDPDTSWAAAQISPTASKTVKTMVLDVLRAESPLTDEEIFARYKAAGGPRTEQRVRTARHELTHPKPGIDPLVEEYNVVGFSDLGNPARRWVLAGAGMETA